MTFLKAVKSFQSAQYYSNFLRNDAHHVIRKKRPGSLSQKIIALHDNARPHTAKMGWEIMNHPPAALTYSLAIFICLDQ
jgi:hypothetical protein